MNSFNNTINAYIKTGTAAEMHFKRNVQTEGREAGKLSGYFAVRGIIKKPGSFIRAGALVMDMHEICGG